MMLYYTKEEIIFSEDFVQFDHGIAIIDLLLVGFGLISTLNEFNGRKFYFSLANNYCLNE